MTLLLLLLAAAAAAASSVCVRAFLKREREREC